MELYTLDSLFRRTEVIDRFDSLIWTERWAGWGDFELSIRSTRESRSIFTPNVFLTCNVSHRVMRIATIENSVAADGTRTLKVKGRSMESMLEDRVLRSGSTSTTQWIILNRQPHVAMREMVEYMCIPGFLGKPLNLFPNMVSQRHPSIPIDNIPDPVDPITVYLDPQSLYKAVTEMGNAWQLGFRMLLNIDDGQIYFDVYTGSDRTSSQTLYDPVMFAPQLDNLQNTTELVTVEDAKNVAMVLAPNGSREVFAQNVLPDTAGYDRHVVVVDADDITLPAGADLQTALEQRGREVLAEHRPLQAFDGEISQSSQYIYNKDYYLGDLVEIQNEDDVANHMRVTEQIFVSDATGERAYPTLSLDTFVGPGTWLSWPTDKKWIDYDVDIDTVWATLP